MATFTRNGKVSKSVYHSQLREAGPIAVQITKGLTKSSYPGRGNYIAFKVRGDETSYTYEPENPDIDEYLESFLEEVPDRNTWLTLAAFGDRDGAYLELTPIGTEGRASRGAAPVPASPVDRSPTSPPSTPPAGPSEGRDPIAREMWRCLEAGRSIIQQFKKEHEREPSDAELRVALSLFIEYSRSGGERALTTPKTSEGK